MSKFYEVRIGFDQSIYKRNEFGYYKLKWTSTTDKTFTTSDDVIFKVNSIEEGLNKSNQLNLLNPDIIKIIKIKEYHKINGLD